MDPINESPTFLSWAFHLKFFPSILWRLLWPKKTELGPPLSGHLVNHVPMEFTILTILSAGAALFGFMAVIGNNSILGWVFGITGIGGFMALLVSSIRFQAGTRPSYESFSIAFFCFFLTLGIAIGIFIGALEHSRSLGLICCFAGLLPGYVSGIFAGLWIQRLGWIAKFLEMLAGVAIIGMVVLALVLLFG